MRHTIDATKLRIYQEKYFFQVLGKELKNAISIGSQTASSKTIEMINYRDVCFHADTCHPIVFITS